MPRPALTVSRLMIATAALAVGFGALLPLRPQRFVEDAGIAVLVGVMAVVLAAGVDRAAFGRGRRSFWVGFTAVGWLVAAAALVELAAVKDVLVKHGPPILGARHAYLLERVAALRAQEAGMDIPMPPAPVGRLLTSMVVESGLGLALGVLAACAGGLVAASATMVVRRLLRPGRRSSPV